MTAVDTGLMQLVVQIIFLGLALGLVGLLVSRGKA